MPGGYYRDTWVEVDLDAIEANVTHLKRHLSAKTKIMAVVKADGYGHGAVPVAEVALSAGATWLGVAFLDEALALRQDGIEAPILVLGWTRPEDVELAARNNISLTVFQKDWLREASDLYQAKGPVFFHVKCDTGMGRVGVRTNEELTEVVEALKADPRFIAEGVFTHFATADEQDETYFNEQYSLFETTLAELKGLGINPNIVHCGNSAAALKFPNKMFNMVRFGISMYGLAPSAGMKSSLPFTLREALSLRSRLAHIKKLDAGEAVSYGATYITDKETWVGTIPIGYADGWLRALSGQASVIIDGRRVPIIGRICMDQMMCKLDHNYPVGAEVTLIGAADGDSISIDEIASYLGTINYEIPCMISKRVPRIYFKDGKKIRMSNPIL